MPRKQVIRSRHHARKFITSIPDSTLRNLIAIVLCSPRDTQQLARILGCSLRQAQRIVKKFVEKGIVEAVKYKEWIILDVNEHIKAEIIDGISAVVNIIADNQDIPRERIQDLLKIILEEVLNLRGRPRINLTQSREIPYWAEYIYNKTVVKARERRKELMDEEVILEP